MQISSFSGTSYYRPMTTRSSSSIVFGNQSQSQSSPADIFNRFMEQLQEADTKSPEAQQLQLLTAYTELLAALPANSAQNERGLSSAYGYHQAERKFFRYPNGGVEAVFEKGLRYDREKYGLFYELKLGFEGHPPIPITVMQYAQEPTKFMLSLDTPIRANDFSKSMFIFDIPIGFQRAYTARSLETEYPTDQLTQTLVSYFEALSKALGMKEFPSRMLQDYRQT